MDTEGQTTPPPVKARLGPVGQFTVKMLIAAIVVLVASDMVLEMAFTKMDDVLRRNIEIVRADIPSGKNIGARQLWQKFEYELTQAADPNVDMSPERQQKILAQMRVVADRVRPFASEALAIMLSTLDAAQPGAKK